MSDRAPCLLGLDIGLTVTKAVVFDAAGVALAVARRRVPQIMPAPRHVERDMTVLWRASAEAMTEAVAASGAAERIAGVGVSAHGDGVYPVDAEGAPLGNGVLSLDSRAGGVVAGWEGDGTAAAALELSGQMPHASAPSALLAWMRAAEPERFARIGHVLACKDWLRLCLTGTIGTDLTEASTSFTNVRTQDHDADILRLYGLDALAPALPGISAPHDVVGRLTPAAARACGLRAGLPVVAGVHDVTASALGVGGYGAGRATLVAGTYSINETVSAAPKVDARWFCRNGLRRGEWNNMAISPASAANYDWVLDTLCATDRAAQGDALHQTLAAEIETARARPAGVMFHPYLFGSPHGPGASAGFLGLRGWHGRGDMLRALIEGIAFNHRLHVDALRDGFAITALHLTGGISNNPVHAQIFADALGLPLSVADVPEPAAWGAALCAGAGVGLFDSPVAGAQAAPIRRYTPDPAQTGTLDARYRLHLEIAEALAPVWPKLDALEGGAA